MLDIMSLKDCFPVYCTVPQRSLWMGAGWAYTETRNILWPRWENSAERWTSSCQKCPWFVTSTIVRFGSTQTPVGSADRCWLWRTRNCCWNRVTSNSWNSENTTITGDTQWLNYQNLLLSTVFKYMFYHTNKIVHNFNKKLDKMFDFLPECD